MNSGSLIRSQVDRLQALWRYRGFVFSMVWREFRGNYLGSLLGSVWSILNPMAMIFIYTVIFSKIMRAKLPGVADTMGYGIFVCSGVITWGFFSDLLGRCPKMFVENATLLKKVNFPRTTLPLIVFFSSALNFLIIFGIFMAFLLLTGRLPGMSILAFVPLLFLQQLFVLGAGVFLGTLNVFFRDVTHIVSIVLQFWFWFTPVVYPLNILPPGARRLVELNPMTRFVTSYQQIVLYNQWPQWSRFGWHLLGALLALGIGFVVFQRLSGEMVDEL